MTPSHIVLKPFNFNFLCPTNPIAVLVSTFHAEFSSEVEITALHAMGINQKLSYNGAIIIEV